MAEDVTPPSGIVSQDLWGPLRHLTSARIGLGRKGDAPPLNSVLDFQFAHAQARDAVHAALDSKMIAAGFPDNTVLQIKSAAPDRTVYLRRPDLGRHLDDESRALLQASAGSPCDLLFVISDGLSATAVHSHAVPFVQACLDRINTWPIGPLVIATQARVALADEAGEILGARICVNVIGERPGLSVADSLGVYLTYGPRTGRRDSERNCISNIHQHGGLSYAQAADKLVWLIGEALRRNLTGVSLKDDNATQQLLEAEPAQET